MYPNDEEDENKYISQLPIWLAASAAGVLFITINLIQFPSVILFLWIFSCGVLFSFVLLLRATLVPSMLLWSRRDKLPVASSVGKSASATSVVGCPVCGDDKCARHRGEVSKIKYEPWDGIHVRKEIDQALSRFMELVMKTYVDFWYKEVTTDSHGERLLRQAFRHVAGVFALRLSKIDIAVLISGKILQAAVEHFNMYVRAKRRVGRPMSGDEVVDAVFREYGTRVHRALRGGPYAERQYLCRVAEAVMPHCLPGDVENSRGLKVLLREIVGPGLLQIAVDTLINPDWINHIIMVLLAPAVPVEELDIPQELVPLLDSFSRPLQLPSLMVPPLQVIKTNTKLLLPFMNFLKARGQIGLLQFCLETGEFHDELDRASDECEDKGVLLRKVQCIYTSYFADQSQDHLSRVGHGIAHDLKRVCDALDLGKEDQAFRILSETMPIARAYSKVFGILERDYVPLFLASNEHLAQLCGPKFPTVRRLTQASSTSRLEPLKNLAKLGRRLKRQLRTDSSSEDPSVGNTPSSSATAEMLACLNVDEEELGEDVTQNPALHDGMADGDGGEGGEGSGDDGVLVDHPDDVELSHLYVNDFSTWVVQIQGVESRYIGKRAYFAYRVVCKDSNDPTAADRDTVSRRFSEFFVLHKRLTQFHADLDIVLPVKKLVSLARVTPKQTLEKSQQPLEAYLQQLVQHPSLKRSQALYNFLTDSSVVFTKTGGRKLTTLTSIPRILKSEVLGKPKYLEPFLNAFLSSTFGGVPEHSPEDLLKLQKEREDIEKVANEFRQSAAVEVPAEKRFWEHRQPDSDPLPIDGLFDLIIYFVENLFHPPKWLHVLLMSGKIVGHKTLDAYLDTFLLGKVEILKADATIIDLINLFTETIFEDEPEERTEEQKEERRKEAIHELVTFFPGVLGLVFGKQVFNDGCEEFMNILQHRELNKQLAFSLLDIAVEQLFPELALGENSG